MIYFVAGMNNREFKYFEILENLRKNNKEMEESFFDIMLKEEGDFLEKINFNSIFSGKELIVLKRAEKLKNIEKLLNHINSLEIFNKEIIIDYEKEDGKISEKLKKKLEEMKKNKKLEIYLFSSNDDNSIIKYIESELKISNKDSLKLIEMIGNNPFKVKNEIEKIKIFLDGQDFNFNLIKNIVSAEKEYKLYEMVNNILENNVKDTMIYLEKTKEYMGILYSIYNELEVMYKLVILINNGSKFSNNYNFFKEQFNEIKNIFKNGGKIPNSYSIFKKLQKVKNYSEKNLRYLLYKIWEIEKDIKKGKIEMATGVENIILDIVNIYGKK